jgi:hypothetical protein
MKAGALVYCLLDAEGVYTPEGYELVDTAHVGDYELRLWRGMGYVGGSPVKFNEVSLNAVGRSFDPESQKKKYTGSIHGLGKRGELLYTVASWIKQFGDLYIGSYVPGKLSLYHKLFKRYLPQLSVSDPYAPFDECEGTPEYFHVSGTVGVVESILQDSNLYEVDRYLKILPSVEEQATARAVRIFTSLQKKGSVNEDNFGDMAEDTVNEVVNNFGYVTGNEVVDIDFFNTVLRGVLLHASRK